jgi:hypothetical protein
VGQAGIPILDTEAQHQSPACFRKQVSVIELLLWSSAEHQLLTVRIVIPPFSRHYGCDRPGVYLHRPQELDWTNVPSWCAWFKKYVARQARHPKAFALEMHYDRKTLFFAVHQFSEFAFCRVGGWLIRFVRDADDLLSKTEL